MYSLLRRVMKFTEISFGHAASHSYWFVQLPNPSLSIALTILRTLSFFSTTPCGKRAKWDTLAETNNIADAFLHAATHAPHPMQVAASIARSASTFGIGSAFPSGAPQCLH